MEYKETVKRCIAEFCRLLLGCVFIFSGVVKAIDPMGGAIKIGDYFTAFNLSFLQPFTVLAAFNLAALEFTLGICMLLGVYRRYVTFLVLLFMSLTTPLTLYLALFNPVSDCGCFGDALVITNWQTFYKNIILLVASICTFIYNQRLIQCYSFHVYWFVALWAYVYVTGFAYRNYYHLPIIDFRPYKVGVNIPLLMAVPEGAPQDEYRYSFIYEKEGKQKVFGLENAPVDDSTWTFVESKTELIKQGYVPPISTFHIYDNTDHEITDSLLNDSNPVFLLIAPRFAEAKDDRIDEINNIYDYALEHGIGFYCITGSSDEEVAEWSDNTGAEYSFLKADDVLLKTIVRSNPGLLLLRKGTILMKWHYNDVPKEEELKAVVDECLAGNTNYESKEDARLTTNLFSFAVPLSLVWLYDLLRNRFRRKKKESK